MWTKLKDMWEDGYEAKWYVFLELNGVMRWVKRTIYWYICSLHVHSISIHTCAIHPEWIYAIIWRNNARKKNLFKNGYGNKEQQLIGLLKSHGLPFVLVVGPIIFGKFSQRKRVENKQRDGRRRKKKEEKFDSTLRLQSFGTHVKVDFVLFLEYYRPFFCSLLDGAQEVSVDEKCMSVYKLV